MTEKNCIWNLRELKLGNKNIFALKKYSLTQNFNFSHNNLFFFTNNQFHFCIHFILFQKLLHLPMLTHSPHISLPVSKFFNSKHTELLLHNFWRFLSEVSTFLMSLATSYVTRKPYFLHPVNFGQVQNKIMKPEDIGICSYKRMWLKNPLIRGCGWKNDIII